MPTYFVDTWFFIACLSKVDPEHVAAMRLANALRVANFVTHDGVLIELLTFFSAHGWFWRREVAVFARDVIYGRRYKATPLSRELFEQALTLYESRQDKEYSLTDCASMILIQRRGITHVLTNDHHFRQEGFTVVSE